MGSNTYFAHPIWRPPCLKRRTDLRSTRCCAPNSAARRRRPEVFSRLRRLELPTSFEPGSIHNFSLRTPYGPPAKKQREKGNWRRSPLPPASQSFLTICGRSVSCVEVAIAGNTSFYPPRPRIRDLIRILGVSRHFPGKGFE